MTAPLVRPFPLEAGHPANHGYVQCMECGVQLRDVGVNVARVLGRIVCFDVYACARFSKERARHQFDARGEEVMYLDAYAQDLMFEARRFVADPPSDIEPGRLCMHGVPYARTCAECEEIRKGGVPYASKGLTHG